AVQREVVRKTTQGPVGRFVGGFMAGLISPFAAPYGSAAVEKAGQLADVPLAQAQAGLEAIASNADVATKLALSFDNAPPASSILRRIKVEGGNYAEGEV